ncbi:hypothetical protein [Kitasatospora sp. NPDC001175]|uniref:hypothetical protein n=1 Tax=Kitasatospora sp. NPDC001175 TaxID=3157103 RepID=UPI003D03A176
MRPLISSRATPPRGNRPHIRYLHPRTREGAAVLCALALLLVEVIVLGLVPSHARPLIGTLLLGAWVIPFVLVAAVLRGRRSAARRAGRPTWPVPPPGGQWYGEDALEGYPSEEVARLLPASADPGQNRLQTAWVLASHGHDAAWIAHHLDLPADLAHLLADTAAHRATAHRA